MKKTLFLLVLVVLAVSSCATARYYGGFTPENARQDMALMGPVSSIYYLDEKGYLVDAPKAVFRMVRDCLLSGQLLGEHTERIALATPAARNL